MRSKCRDLAVFSWEFAHAAPRCVAPRTLCCRAVRYAWCSRVRAIFILSSLRNCAHFDAHDVVIPCAKEKADSHEGVLARGGTDSVNQERRWYGWSTVKARYPQALIAFLQSRIVEEARLSPRDAAVVLERYSD